MNKMLRLTALLLAISASIHPAQEATKFQVEVWQPPGMPLELQYGFYEPNIIRVTKTIADDARKISILAVPVDENNNAVRGEYLTSYRMVSDRPHDPMTWGTADKRVKKLILIPEWIQFPNGTWMLDEPFVERSDSDKNAFFDLQAFLKRGKAGLKPARFKGN